MAGSKRPESAAPLLEAVSEIRQLGRALIDAERIAVLGHNGAREPAANVARELREKLPRLRDEVEREILSHFQAFAHDARELPGHLKLDPPSAPGLFFRASQPGRRLGAVVVSSADIPISGRTIAGGAWTCVSGQELDALQHAEQRGDCTLIVYELTGEVASVAH